jgi:hypothetical protein
VPPTFISRFSATIKESLRDGAKVVAEINQPTTLSHIFTPPWLQHTAPLTSTTSPAPATPPTTFRAEFIPPHIFSSHPSPSQTSSVVSSQTSTTPQPSSRAPPNDPTRKTLICAAINNGTSPPPPAIFPPHPPQPLHLPPSSFPQPCPPSLPPSCDCIALPRNASPVGSRRSRTAHPSRSPHQTRSASTTSSGTRGQNQPRKRTDPASSSITLFVTSKAFPRHRTPPHRTN